MKNCTDCKYAVWKKSQAGRLHPSGEGKCGCVVKIPALPGAYHWLSNPNILGGFINRREELKEHCPYFVFRNQPRKERV